MTTDIPRVQSVSVIGAGQVYVEWADGGAEQVDLTGWIATGGAILAALAVPEIFARAAVGEYGSGVTWDDDEGDLTIDALHLHRLAAEQRHFGSLDAKAWQERLGLSNMEVATLLGMVASTWSAYKAGSPIPAAVAIACRSVERDPVVMQAHFRPARPAGRPRAAARPGRG